MEYEIKTIQHQSYGSDAGERDVVVFFVDFTEDGVTTNAVLEYDDAMSEEEILAAIEAKGAELSKKKSRRKFEGFPMSGAVPST